MKNMKIVVLTNLVCIAMAFVGGFASGYSKSFQDSRPLMCSNSGYQMISYNNTDTHTIKIDVNDEQYNFIKPILIDDKIRYGDKFAWKALYFMLRIELLKPYDMDNTFKLQQG